MAIFLDCRVRFHYGHPDIFDRIFHLTRGGISKASKTINLSEDVFAGKLKFLSVESEVEINHFIFYTIAAFEFCLQGIIPYCAVGI